MSECNVGSEWSSLSVFNNSATAKTNATDFSKSLSVYFYFVFVNTHTKKVVFDNLCIQQLKFSLISQSFRFYFEKIDILLLK